MRPNQNKRMRGRNPSNNRKGPNPLSRSYESNGPDVKIRGTAHHIGEKYLQLARDAQSSGDPVMAESFLQHAEHYFRLIAAAQSAQQAAQGTQRPAGEAEAEDFEDEEDFSGGMDRFASPIERAAPPAYAPGSTGQPAYPDRDPGYNNGGTERPQYERQERGPRQERNNFQERGYQNRGYQDRPQDRNYQDRGDRPAGDRQGAQPRDGESRSGRGGRDYRRDNSSRDQSSRDPGGRDNGPRENAPRDSNRDNGGRYERAEPRGNVDTIGGNKGLPAFITAPVRLQPEAHLSDEQPVVAEVLDREEVENEGTGFHLRPRRRRRGKPEMSDGAPEAASTTDPVGD